MVVNPENSVFYDSYVSRNPNLTAGVGSRIKGIGRPQVEVSFQPDIIDAMLKVENVPSIATIHWLEQRIGRKRVPEPAPTCGGAAGGTGDAITG